MPELLEDIVGINAAGEVCHPFKGVRGTKRGHFSFTLSNDNTSFQGATEALLRRMIAAGDFDYTGRIRMVPVGAKSTSGAGALRVVKYRGKKLPLKGLS